VGGDTGKPPVVGEMKFSMTTPWSGSVALAKARTVRPVIASAVAMNCSAVAT
jgi:hypothetical protein